MAKSCVGNAGGMKPYSCNIVSMASGAILRAYEGHGVTIMCSKDCRKGARGTMITNLLLEELFYSCAV